MSMSSKYVSALIKSIRYLENKTNEKKEKKD